MTPRVRRARELLADVIVLWAGGDTADREGIAAAISEMVSQRPQVSLTERIEDELREGVAP